MVNAYTPFLVIARCQMLTGGLMGRAIIFAVIATVLIADKWSNGCLYLFSDSLDVTCRQVAKSMAPELSIFVFCCCFFFILGRLWGWKLKDFMQQHTKLFKFNLKEILFQGQNSRKFLNVSFFTFNINNRVFLNCSARLNSIMKGHILCHG